MLDTKCAIRQVSNPGSIMAYKMLTPMVRIARVPGGHMPPRANNSSIQHRKHERLTPMRYRTQTALGLLIFSLASFARSADVISIWGGARGTMVLKSDGTVWTWGANFGGKLGIGDATMNRSLVPVEVHDAANVNYLNSISGIMGGELHNLALKADGTLW